MYVFVARCIAYHFSAKQPTDVPPRKIKLTMQDLSKIRERFQSFLRGDTPQMTVDEAFTNALKCFNDRILRTDRLENIVKAGAVTVYDLQRLFRGQAERRIRSMPEIDGLNKETILNTWTAKFDTVLKGEEDVALSASGASGRGKQGSTPKSPRGGVQQLGHTDFLMSKDQLFDMFQQILGVKKLEHQLIFNALQVILFKNIF